MTHSFHDSDYKTIVEKMPFAVLVFEMQGDHAGKQELICTYCNPYLLEMYAASKEDLVGKSFDEIRDLFVVKEDTYLAEESKSMLLDTTVNHAFEFCYHQKRRDGSHFWVKGYTNWIIPGKQCQSVFYDCTHEVLLEEKERRTQALLETVLDTTETPIFWKDTNRRFIGANRAFLETLGLESVKIILGKTDEEMGWHKDPEACREIEETVIRDNIHSDAVASYCNIRGRERLISSSMHPLILNGQTTGLVGSFLDITEYVAQQDKIEQLNEELRDALKDAEKASEAKSLFLARMSHDMRTPLTTIMGMTHQGLLSAGTKEEKERYKAIQEGSRYLLTLITDILDSRRINEGKLELMEGPTDLREIRKQVDNIVRPGAEEKDIFFSVQAPGTSCLVRADAKRLQQILINLLSNAIKCTPEGGTVMLKISELHSTSEHVDVLYEVTDNGIGMSKEFQTHMFEEFSQEIHAGHVEEGSGLGLTIVKALVDLMGGNIECTSEPFKGTSFRVLLPFERVKDEDLTDQDKLTLTGLLNEDMALSGGTPEKHLEGKRCLICEDVAINAMIIAQTLENMGVHTDIAANGLLGVDMVRNHPYDFILMDIRMPIMDGLQATQEIRSFDRKIPIIALSANNFPEDIRRSLDAGMNAHVAKPIDNKELIGVILTFLHS